MTFRLFNTQNRTEEAVQYEKGKKLLCKSDAKSLFKEKILRNLKIFLTPIAETICCCKIIP